jgi:hypothetical protein
MSRALEGEGPAMTRLPLQTLYFDDLSVGMTETYAKTVKSSDVVGWSRSGSGRAPAASAGSAAPSSSRARPWSRFRAARAGGYN